MKTLTALSLVLAATLAVPAFAGDAAAGKQKATACVACHGDQGFPGIFYTYQLAGRNADKLTIKTNKYRTGKILHPIMNIFTVNLTEKDVEDISAYYQSLEKPALTSPFIKIKGDDEESAASASMASVVAAAK